MWIADHWKDYKVLDASNGEKLEKWGDYFLVRPDPQVIWDTPHSHPGWKKKNGHYHRSAKGGGQWEFFQLPDEWSISYSLNTPASSGHPLPGPRDGSQAGNLVFRLKPFAFKHTGLFPEQAVNWEWFSGLIRKSARPAQQPVKILNLFAYTGGATLAAAPAGLLLPFHAISTFLIQYITMKRKRCQVLHHRRKRWSSPPYSPF